MFRIEISGERVLFHYETPEYSKAVRMFEKCIRHRDYFGVDEPISVWMYDRVGNVVMQYDAGLGEL